MFIPSDLNVERTNRNAKILKISVIKSPTGAERNLMNVDNETNKMKMTDP